MEFVVINMKVNVFKIRAPAVIESPNYDQNSTFQSMPETTGLNQKHFPVEQTNPSINLLQELQTFYHPE